MSSKKCMTCGLVNAAAATVCKRCDSALTDTSYLLDPKQGRTNPASAHPGAPSGFIGDQVRRCNRNLLAANLCLAAAVLVALLLSGKYYYNFCFGPFPMTEQTLTSLRNADQVSHRFVVISIDNAIDYSVEEFETRSNGRERVVAAYYSLMFGDKLLLVKAPPGHHEQQFSGYLENMSGYHPGQREVLAKFVAHDPGSRGAYLPVMLDATDVRTPGWIGLAIGLPLFILGAWNTKKALTRSSNPSAHPIMLSLEKYGSPVTIAAAIDRETNSETSRPTGSVFISSSWLMNARLFTLDAKPLVELVWAYKKVTKHSVNFIPTGKTYVTVIWDRRRKSMEVSTGRSEQKTHRILEALVARAPWLLIGYSEDLAQDWTADAAGVINAVDQRRNQITRDHAETNESNLFPGKVDQVQTTPQTSVEVSGHQQVREMS
jgi:hypothetical protein